jgi:Protein of unknown function (DUF3500)
MSRISLITSLVSIFACMAQAHDAPHEMEHAATDFLRALTSDQKSRANLEFDAAYDPSQSPHITPTSSVLDALPPADERHNWHFVPRPRRGLPIKDMTTEQRLLAHGLLSSGLSHSGYAKTVGIMSLESVLASLENNPTRRDPELYFFSIFGTPGQAPWGWRVEGHHVSLNFTIPTKHAQPVMTPSFFGSNPGEVKAGPRAGTRILEQEEELARSLVKSLADNQRAKAVIMTEAPKEIINVPGRNDTKAEGIPWPDLTEPQRDLLSRLIREYLFRHRPDVAENEFSIIMKAPETLHFAWAGDMEKGKPHYYRVQTGSFVLEYDNVQNGGNHVHSVWRDFDRDFGHDVLADHYKNGHAK